jgi:hypothetical protein
VFEGALRIRPVVPLKVNSQVLQGCIFFWPPVRLVLASSF